MERQGRRLLGVELWILIMAGMILPTSLAFLSFLQPSKDNHQSISRLFLCETNDADDLSSDANTGSLIATVPCSRPTRAPRLHGRRKSFESMFPRLVAFQEKHGHTEVSKEQDRELYTWTKNLRYNYLWQVRGWPDSSGKRRRLVDEKLQRLEALGFSWETKRDWKRWSTMLVALTSYRNEYNTTHIDPTIDRDLYDWTKAIRNNYRHQALNMTVKESSSNYRRPRLASGKMNALNDIGFDWEPEEGRQMYLRWPDMIQRLEAFHAEHGHAKVPRGHEDGELYRWTQNVIVNYGHQISSSNNDSNSTAGSSVAKSRHFLSPKRLQQLRELGFGWEQRSTMWERSYQELCDYWKKNGHCHVTMLENRKLSNFVQNQRREYRRYLAGNATTLTPERMEALQRIRFDWARSHAKLWEERHRDLQAYLQETGTTNVPQKYASNYQLGHWTMNQRTKYRLHQNGETSGMTDKRIRELEKLEFQWTVPQMRWNRMYERLKRYQQDHGHFEIETSDGANSDLRQWLNEQRHFHKTKKYSRLSKERIGLMQSLPGFEWRRRRSEGPSKDDWSDLFVAIKEKGIVPGAKARQHWFEGIDRFTAVKTEWTEDELVALWNEDEDDDDDDGEFFEDEESRMFLSA